MLRTAYRFIARFIGEEKAQDAFEYLLVIGGVSVAVILAITTPVASNMVTAVVDGVCAAINSLPQIVVANCTP